MSLESHLSERQFFIVSLAGLFALILGLYLAILRPRMQELTRLRQEVERKTIQLRTSGYLLGEAPLLQKKREIERVYQNRLEEWEEVTGLLTSFDQQEDWQSRQVANIDYKFYLYLTRNRLSGKARNQNIEVPALLGLPDVIESDDVAREKMLQLLAIEKVVDTAIEYGIANIRSIDPLNPIVHRMEEDQAAYMEEYPLRVIFEGPMKGLFRLWEAMFQPGQAMLLRNVAMEKTSLRQADEVRMTATLSSFLFMEVASTLNAARNIDVIQNRAMGF
jgi:hypothetical protein